MVRSSRLADELKAAARVADAWYAGVATGGKAVVNGAATAIKNVATLGLSSSQLELIGVTKAEREAGYNHAVAIATASGDVFIAVVTGGVSAVLSKGGTIARAASRRAGHLRRGWQHSRRGTRRVDAANNGVTLRNGLPIAAARSDWEQTSRRFTGSKAAGGVGRSAASAERQAGSHANPEPRLDARRGHSCPRRSRSSQPRSHRQGGPPPTPPETPSGRSGSGSGGQAEPPSLPKGFDPSKGFASFDDFKDAFGAAGPGKAWHHIVEQTINSGKFAARSFTTPRIS